VKSGTIATTLCIATTLALGTVAWRAVTATPAQAATPTVTDAKADRAARITRGKYLVNTSGCTDCHTPVKMGANGPEPDLARSLSGHPESMELPPPPQPNGPWIASVAATMTAWNGPWGTSFTANLTPDPETGLGKWTEENFVQTIRTGRHLGSGRPILPPMPIPIVQNFTDEDLKSIYWYLQSIPAVKNRVPTPLPPG
jgi:mono/diheme cytochrome c family protein